MKAVLFDYPQRAAFGKVVPKARIVAHSRARGLRDRLSRELVDIHWVYKLAPISTNLAASKDVPEIQVFRLELKPGVPGVGETTLRAIDQAIPSPIVFEVTKAGRTRTVAAYKRPSEADSGKTVLSDYLWGEPLPAETQRQPLPTATSMANLYRALLDALMPIAARRGEPLREQLDRLARLRGVERDCARLEKRLARETQFNRKVAINSDLRQVKARLRALLAGR